VMAQPAGGAAYPIYSGFANLGLGGSLELDFHWIPLANGSTTLFVDGNPSVATQVEVSGVTPVPAAGQPAPTPTLPARAGACWEIQAPGINYTTCNSPAGQPARCPTGPTGGLILPVGQATGLGQQAQMAASRARASLERMRNGLQLAADQAEIAANQLELALGLDPGDARDRALDVGIRALGTSQLQWDSAQDRLADYREQVLDTRYALDDLNDLDAKVNACLGMTVPANRAPSSTAADFDGLRGPAVEPVAPLINDMREAGSAGLAATGSEASLLGVIETYRQTLNAAYARANLALDQLEAVQP
jgi:hypothetical protein